MEISKEFIEGRLLEVIEKNIYSLFSRRGKDYDEMSKPLKVLSFSFDEELSVLSLKLNMKAVPLPEKMFFFI